MSKRRVVGMGEYKQLQSLQDGWLSFHFSAVDQFGNKRRIIPNRETENGWSTHDILTWHVARSASVCHIYNFYLWNQITHFKDRLWLRWSNPASNALKVSQSRLSNCACRAILMQSECTIFHFLKVSKVVGRVRVVKWTQLVFNLRGGEYECVVSVDIRW